jgi:hypothetical protein
MVGAAYTKGSFGRGQDHEEKKSWIVDFAGSSFDRTWDGRTAIRLCSRSSNAFSLTQHPSHWR